MATIGETTRPAFAYDLATDTWIPVGVGPHAHTPAAIGAIASSVVTTKGDLIVATGSGTVVRQGVGADGSVLMANSAESDGVSWAGPSNIAGKNAVINGGMDFFQRATSSSSAGYTTADRWFFNANASSTVSQESTIVPSGFRYSLKLTANSSATPYIIQSIETLNTIPLVNRVITVSFYVYASSSFQINTLLLHSTSTDNAAGGSWSQLSPTTGGSVTAGTSWQRVTATFTVPSDAKTIGTYIFPSANIGAGQSYYVTGVQLELGSVATPFSRAGGSIAGELAACQRYYQKSYPAGIYPGAYFQGGYSIAIVENNIPSSNYYHFQPLLQTMRAEPTVTVYSGSGAVAKVSTSGGSDLAANSAVQVLITDNHFTIQNQSGGALTASAGGFLFYYVASAEL
jgi:hypothetical protein